MASEKDIQDVIKTLIAEGVGEGQEGMRRIAETILNRAEQRGISPAEVVRQRAQYTGYSSPGPAAVKAFNDPKALSAAQAAWQLAQGPDDPTNGANHYWNPSIVNPSWAGSMTPLGQFGNHAFATDRAPRPRAVPPVPAALSQPMAASRAVTSPSGGNTALQAALGNVATRERNRVTPAVRGGNTPIPESYQQWYENAFASQSQMTPAQAAAFYKSVGITPRQTSATPARTVSASAFNGDPLTPASGTVVASIPSRPSLPPPVRLAASSGIDYNPQAPATIQSGGLSRDALARQRQYAANQINPPAPTLPQVAAPRITPPNATQVAAATGFRLPTPPVQTAARIAPVPFQRPTAVGSALDVVPMPAMPIPRPVNRGAPLPPMPIARPGIGGPAGPAPAANLFGIKLPWSGNPMEQMLRPAPLQPVNAQTILSAARAVGQSGDTSAGNQAEAAAARASGNAWREAQERKK